MLYNIADVANASGCVVEGVGLWLIACWDRRFKSCWGHGCLSLVFIGCCVYIVPCVVGYLLIQRSATGCSVLLLVVQKLQNQAASSQFGLYCHRKKNCQALPSFWKNLLSSF